MGKHSIQINDDKLFDEIVAYCKANNLTISFFCTDMLRKQFLMERYGDIPFGNFHNSEPLQSEKDKIVTTAVIHTGKETMPWVSFEETVNEDGSDKKITAIQAHKQPQKDVPSLVYSPWVSVGTLTDEEKEEFGLTNENSCTLVNLRKLKENKDKCAKDENKSDDLINKDIETTKQEKTTKPKKRRL